MNELREDDLRRVIEAAAEVSGDRAKAEVWALTHSIPSFADKTAYELVSEGRVEDLLGYIRSIAGGFAG